MKTRGIIMSAESVRAILSGTKTVTRRVVKPQPVHVSNGNFAWSSTKARKPGSGPGGTLTLDDLAARCPYPVGSRLWVREAWYSYMGSEEAGSPLVLVYKADGGNYPWKSPIHMRQLQSRIALEVTAVRVERLQSIGELDCENELGVEPYSLGNDAYPRFQKAWERINGRKHPWASDPWVWVVAFRVEAPR